jgi:AraC-like DNA-binding protein
VLTFTQIEFIDLFFRFASVGSLFFIGLVWLDKSVSVHLWISRCLLCCLSGYLLLTAPIDDDIYGQFRGLVLLLTELLPYFLWLYVFVLIKPEIRTKDIHWLFRASALCLFLWIVYFFAVLKGRGDFHQINHMLGIVLYCHIAFMAIYDFQDDLVQQRRKMRVSVAVFMGTYSFFLTLLEFFDDSLRASTLFSVSNSATIFVLIFLFSTYSEKIKYGGGQLAKSAKKLPNSAPQEEVGDSIPVIFISDLDKMKVLMQQQFYTQSNLTIGVLAQTLRMPEHRLRLLINKHLGYQNFSGFLNSYRISAAKTTLKDPEQARLSVLTIALDLGYGSIGPFNRAFKQTTGFTPSEYRKNIQNRP